MQCGPPSLECPAEDAGLADRPLLEPRGVAGLLDAVTMIGVGLALWFTTANPFVAALKAAAGQ